MIVAYFLPWTRFQGGIELGGSASGFDLTRLSADRNPLVGEGKNYSARAATELVAVPIVGLICAGWACRRLRRPAHRRFMDEFPIVLISAGTCAFVFLERSHEWWNWRLMNEVAESRSWHAREADEHGLHGLAYMMRHFEVLSLQGYWVTIATSGVVALTLLGFMWFGYVEGRPRE